MTEERSVGNCLLMNKWHMSVGQANVGFWSVMQCLIYNLWVRVKINYWHVFYCVWYFLLITVLGITACESKKAGSCDDNLHSHWLSFQRCRQAKPCDEWTMIMMIFISMPYWVIISKVDVHRSWMKVKEKSSSRSMQQICHVPTWFQRMGLNVLINWFCCHPTLMPVVIYRVWSFKSVSFWVSPLCHSAEMQGNGTASGEVMCWGSIYCI